MRKNTDDDIHFHYTHTLHSAATEMSNKTEKKRPAMNLIKAHQLVYGEEELFSFIQLFIFCTTTTTFNFLIKIPTIFSPPKDCALLRWCVEFIYDAVRINQFPHRVARRRTNCYLNIITAMFSSSRALPCIIWWAAVIKIILLNTQTSRGTWRRHARTVFIILIKKHLFSDECVIKIPEHVCILILFYPPSHFFACFMLWY